MSNNTSSSPVNQPNMKGKEKINYDQMNKDKGILMDDEPNVPNNINNNKRKAIVLGEPDHHYYNPNSDDDHDGSKNPNKDGSAAVTEDGSDSTKEQEPNPDQTLVIGILNSQMKKNLYKCTFCDKSFSSPQALGGHQNGHKKERMHQAHNSNSIGNGIQFLNNMAMGMGTNSSSGSSMELPSSPTIPTFRPFFSGETNSLHHYQPNMMMMGYNNSTINNGYHPYHHGLFQNNGGRPSNFSDPGPMVGANYNFAYPHVDSGSGAVEVGNLGTFQHPYEFQRRGFNGGASVNPGAVEIRRTNRIGYNNNNNGGVQRQIVIEACETQQGEFEFVLLPSAARNNKNNNKVEIDFGLVPKRDGNGKGASETD